jgi:integrase
MKLKLDTSTIITLALSSGQTEAFVWDTELAGFGLRLQGRRRTYVVQYRANGHTRRSTLGPVERLTPVEARKGARKLLARAALGHDPQGEKTAKRAQAERTFAKVASIYLAGKKDELRPGSYRGAKLYLTGPYFRPLHAMGIGEITHPDIAARLSAITRAHSSHTAASARRAISALFTWAMQEGWCATNPVVGTRKPAEAKPRDRVLTDTELVTVWKACGDDDFGRIVRLLILLPCRRQEIGGMCYPEFDDFDTGVWTLPAARSKNHRPLTLTLPPVAMEIVRAASHQRFLARDGRDHLFGTRGGRGYSAWDHSKQALDGRLNGAVKPWRLHDLRRSVATKMADIGIEPHIIEAVLGHYSGHRAGVAGVYNRSPYEHAVKAALIRWSEHVLTLVEGRDKDNVVSLHA